MVLQKDNEGFRNSYYLVGTGMIRVPLGGIVYVDEAHCQGSASEQAEPTPDKPPRSISSKSRLLRFLDGVRGG